MKLQAGSWVGWLQRLFSISPSRRQRKLWQRKLRERKRRQAMRKLRACAFQGLEARQLLSASLQVFNGSTQLTSGGSDSFGTVVTGATDNQAWTLKNVGDATLTVSSDSLPTGFSTTNSLPLSLDPGQSATFTVSLNTNSIGQYSGTFDLYTNDSSNDPFTLNLSGAVQQSSSGGTLELSDGSTQLSNGASDSFGSVLVGASDTKSFTVENVGSGTLNINSMSLPSGYSLNTSLPLSLATNQTATLNVSLDTSAAGNFDGQILIQSSDTSDNPFTLNVSATVATSSSPSIKLQDGSTTIANGGSDSFGTVTEGTSDSRTYTVTNQGLNTLTVSAISLPAGYSSSTTLPLSISSGSSTTFVVGLSTATAGTFTGTMALTTNDPSNGTFNVSLSGTVTAPAPVMVLQDGSTTIANGGSDSLGTWSVGDTATKTFTVSNSGTASLSVSAVGLPNGFILQTAMPLSIAAGGSGTFVVAMNTAAAASYSGTMSITDTDSNNNPYNVTLSGTVTFPTVAVAATIATANEQTGAAGQFTVSRTGATDDALTVNYTVGGTATPGADYTALSGTVTILAGSTSAAIAVNPLSGQQVQQIVLPAPTGGTYTLSIGSSTTAALPYNASAAAVAAALGGLSNVGAGRVSVTGSGTSASPFVATFDGAFGGPSLPQITGDGSLLTGGTSTTISTSVTTPADGGGTVVATLASSASYTVGSPSQDTVNVIGDELPVITVVATTPSADEVAGTSGAFTLYRNGSTSGALTVYYVLGGSTLDGVDYQWIAGNATFAVGQATTQVTITPINNGLAGPSKTATLTLNAAPPNVPPDENYALAGANSDTVTITDTNLPVVAVWATTPTANEEGATGLNGGVGQFTVTRTGDTTNAMTVNYTVGGTAVAGSQYQALSGSVTIAAGAASATINVTPIDDGGAGTSTSSTVVVTLSASSAYTVAQPPPAGESGGASDTVTIDDDDLPQVSIAASTPLAVESTATPGAFTISIDAAQSAALTIPYTVSGSAISGTDFETLSGSATIPAGQTSVVVSVVPLNDPAEVGFTTVQATLTAGSGYELTASSLATVAIQGNTSVPSLTLAATTPTADEIAGTTGTFTVTRTGSTAAALIAYYTIAGSAVDGTDYNLLPGSVTIPAGQASTTIIVTPKSDPAMQDTSRTVVLNLTNYGGPSGASYAIGNPAGDTVTINDLPTATLQATTATAAEHELTPGVFTVTRANDPLMPTQALTVNYTLSGTAQSGTDFQSVSGSVTIPVGQASTTINITPIDAGLVGGSQTVVLTLASGGYLIGSPATDTVTINDDDPPTITLQATTATASEASGAAGVFTVTRNGPTTAALTVPYTVAGTATAGTNYQALSGSVTIPAGSATATIDVSPIDVHQIGGSATVIAALTAGAGYALGTHASDTVTILENDLPTVTLAATQSTATESSASVSAGTFTVTRNGLTTNPLIVLYTIGGTAANGVDYQSLVGNVTIPAGAASATITVTPINDPAVLQDQTVILTLAATSQYVSGTADSGTVTIFDDNLPTVGVQATANADEEAATAGQFTVTRIGPTDNPLTVNYSVSGTAESGIDYTALPASIVIPAGQSTATIAVTPVDDGASQEEQEITVPAATGGTYTLSIGTDTTTALPYNATAAAVASALALLPEVGTGNVTVYGSGTSASPFLINFLGGLIDVNVPQITGDASQLTGTYGVSVTTTTPGVQGTSQVEQVGYTAASAITGGTFTLSYNGNSTGNLAYNASAAAVQTAVAALPGIGAGNVVVTTVQTGPDTYIWQLAFQGALAAQSLTQVTTNPMAITVTNGSASADDSTPTPGSQAGGTNAVQQVAVTGAVGGTFTLTYQGATTSPIADNASAATVSTALEALSTIGSGNVAVSGNAGGPWSVTFQGTLGDQSVPQMTADGTGLTAPPVAVSMVSPFDGPATVTVTISSSSTYNVAQPPSAGGQPSGGNPAGGGWATDTVTIADADNVAPTVVATQWTTQIGQTLSEPASGVLSGAQDPAGKTMTAVLLTGVSHGTLTLNADGSFSYTPAGGFQGTDSFVFQAFDTVTYSAPMAVTLQVVPAPAPQISVTENVAQPPSAGVAIANGASDSFGQTWTGTPVSQTFTITNPGTAGLTLSGWTAPAGYTITTAPAASVPAGGSTTMVVQLTATAAGSYTGALSWSDNVAGASPFTVNLSGTVNNLAPVLQVLQGSTALASGASFGFGTTGQNEPLTETFTVTNAGTANLSLSDPINLPAGFSLVDDFASTTLAPGASTTFAVELTAAATGSDSGNLTFGTNDANNAAYTLGLSGTVVASPIVAVLDGTSSIANGSGQDSLGTALVGTALTKTLTIDNNGTAALTLDPTKLVLPAGFSVVTPYATSVAAGGSTTLEIEISGATAGVFSGTLSFPTNDVGQPIYSFQVSGEIDTPAPSIQVFNGSSQITPGTGTLNFGTTPLGTPVDETLTIKNVGTAALTVPASMQLPTGYRLVSIGSGNLAAGASATMVLELLGDFSGSYSGVASLYSNDATEQPFAFNLTGVVDAPLAQVTLAGAAVANQTGSVNFGGTTLSAPVTETFTVTNGGTSDLVLTDPISVPYGFSVTSDFGATTLAPGASTTFGVELNASAAGNYQGTVLLQTNDPDQALYYFAASGQVATPVIAVSDGSTTLANGASDDFGSTAVGTALQRTITIKNTGTGVLTLNDPISLPTGFSLANDFGSTSLNPGASTSFTVELTGTAAGFYGGAVSFDNNATLLGTFLVNVSGSVAAPRLDLMEGTTDVTSYVAQPPSAGSGAAQALDLGATVVGTARSETFTIKNTGTGSLVLSDPIGLPAGFTLTQDFGATTLAAGASTTFVVSLSAAAAGDYSGSITFGTNLPAPPSGSTGSPPGAVGPAFSLPVQGEVIGLTGLRLWDDTGHSLSDGFTSDPTVAGNLVGVLADKSAQVQFGIVPSGQNVPTSVAGSITADSTQAFTYPPAGLTPGAVTIAARVHLVDAVLGDLYTSWSPLSFTLETGTDAAPVVTNLALQTVTVPNSSPPTSSDPAITGSVLNDGNVLGLTVNIDTTGSGQADQTVTTDANGNFVFTPQGLTPGTYTYHFQTVESAYPSGTITGPWEPFVFAIVAPNPPVVDQLSLANVTGPGTSTTTDPTLTGHVTADGNPQRVEVDFDYNGDGVSDASIMANADGTFTFKPEALAVGSVTIKVRAVNVDQGITGTWTSLSFTLAAPQAPNVSTLQLLNDTGSSATDKVTNDPTVTGTLTAVGNVVAGEPSPVANVTVQFDTNGDGLPDGSTLSDANGNFTWTPSGIQPGTVTVAARAVTTDPTSGQTLLGAWTKLTFTYSATEGPVVSALSLAHPTGTDQQTGDPTAIDATLTGTLTNGSALASFLTVQYEIGSDTTPDGSATTDAQGNFTFAPNGLAVGVNTVQVRGITSDPQTGAEVDGAWKSITFILQQDPIAQPPATPADSDPVATGDQVAATSLQADEQGVNNAIASFNTSVGAASTPAGQISVGVGTYTALSGVAGGRAVSGSIFDVQNGSIPAPAGVGSPPIPPSSGVTTTGSSLPQSAPLGLPGGTPLALSANVTTPTAGSGTITNQAISAAGTLGPGNSNLTGTLNGSWTITVTPDAGGNSNVTAWTITVNLSETFDNRLTGAYTDTSTTAAATGAPAVTTTINHSYSDDTGGTYHFYFQASGSTTQTAAGAVLAGTFTLVEGNSYSYSFADSPVATSSPAGASSTSNEAVSTSGSHNFSHVESGGSLSSGGGTGGNAAANVASAFVNNETESFKTIDGSTQSVNNGSADGSDVGGGPGNEVFGYASENFANGGYTGNGADFAESQAFKTEFNETDSSTQTTTDNFDDAVPDGQIVGGGLATVTITSSVDDSESGNWSDGVYLFNSTFDDKDSFHESDQIVESGTESENSGGVAGGGTFSFNETDSADASDEEKGSDSATNTTFTATGTFTDSADANDQASYQDGGGYSGTVTPSPGASGPYASALAAPAETVNGTYNDSATATDNATESDGGTFTDANSGETDQGNETDNASSSLSYTSGGTDNENDANGSAGDSYTDTGYSSGSFSNSDSFSDSPSLDSASGSVSASGTAQDVETGSDHGNTSDASSSVNWNDTVSASSTAGFSESGTYTASDNPSTGVSSDEVKGPGAASATATENDTWNENGTVSGSDSYHFNTGGTDSATAWSNENDTFDDTDSSSTGETVSSSGSFSDGQSASSSAYYNDTGTSTAPSATTFYTDNDNASSTTTYGDSGTVQTGPVNDTSASYSNSGTSEEIDSGTATGTYTQPSLSGAFQASGSDTTSTSNSDSGTYDQSTTYTDNDNSIVSDSTHDTSNVTDSGTFTNGQTGTYNDGQTTDDTSTDSQSGSTTVTGNSTSTSGTFNDDTRDINSDYANANEQQGAHNLGGGKTDYASTTYHDNGSYTASTAAGNPSRSAGFTSGETDVNTDSGFDNGSYGGTTWNSQANDATRTQDTATGSYSGLPGALTTTGTATGDVLATDSGSDSNQRSYGSGNTHNDSASGSDMHHGHASGPFTDTAGAVAAEDINYYDDDRSKAQSQSGNYQAFATGQGGSSTWTDTYSASGKSTHHDSGERNQTTSGTTDNGSGTNTDHGTGSYNTQTVSTFPGGGTTSGWGSGDTADYFTTGTYNISATGETDSDTFDNEDRPSGSSSFTSSYTAPGDPGTHSTSTSNATCKSDNADDGSISESNGSVTNETDNFTDTTTTSDNDNYQAAADQGVMPSVGVDTIPWFLTLEYPWGGQGMLHNPSAYDLSRGTLSTTATASATSDDTETDFAQGTTSDVNGVTNTSESFNDTGSGDYSDSNWQSLTGGYNDSSGSGAYQAIYSSSDNGSEIDASGGTMNGGVTSDGYTQSGETTASSSYSISYSTTSNGDTVAHTQFITSSDRSDVATVAESGDYTTEPPGTTITGTTDNPNGYAISDQTINDDETITNFWSEGYTADLAALNYSVTGNGAAAADGTLTLHSDSVVNVNAAQNKDVQSGNWDWALPQAESSTYNESATYHAAGSSTSATWTTTYILNQSADNSASGGYGNGTQAPVDGAAWAAPATGSADTADATTVKADTEDGEILGIGFSSYDGPVSIAGIVGGGVTPPRSSDGRREAGGPKEPIPGIGEDPSGFGELIKNIEAGLGGKVTRSRIYGSSDGGGFVPDNKPPTGSFASKTAQEIAQEQFDVIKANVDNLGEKEAFKVLLVGHSWGGDKAIEVANILAGMLRNDPKLGQMYANNKILIFLATIDPVGQRANPRAQGGTDPSDRALTARIADWLNLYQIGDRATPIPPYNVTIPALKGGNGDTFPLAPVEQNDRNVAELLSSTVRTIGVD